LAGGLIDFSVASPSPMTTCVVVVRRVDVSGAFPRHARGGQSDIATIAVRTAAAIDEQTI